MQVITTDYPATLQKKPIVWTIAGSDSGGGAGIQADLHTFHSLHVHGCSVIAAITAQNSQGVLKIAASDGEILTQQISALDADLPAKTIKLGMLGSTENLILVHNYLKNFRGAIICDPVLSSSSGQLLFDPLALDLYRHKILTCSTVITPNLPEAELLSGVKILNHADMVKAAKTLHAFGPKAVIIKGGHFDSRHSDNKNSDDPTWAQDFCYLGEESFWLTTPRWSNSNLHGTGCTFAAAIAAALALDYILQDALIIAKAYVSQSIRFAQQLGKGPGPVVHLGWPNYREDIPLLTSTAEAAWERKSFRSCDTQQLGLYPIVDNLANLTMLLELGVNTLQLRVKKVEPDELDALIQEACRLGNAFGCRLFINDYWQLAIKHHAYGVHLGQEDLLTADLAAIRENGLRLGVSSHCYFEIATALGLAPSYIAYGPVYETFLKQMPFCPRGIKSLHYWVSLLDDYPMVAIGGISEARMPEVIATGVGSVAVVSAISQAEDPVAATKRLLAMFPQQ